MMPPPSIAPAALSIGIIIGSVFSALFLNWAISTHYENMALDADCAAYDTKTGELVWKEITNDEQ